ncbi:phage portal protein [Pseudorhodoferax sp. Leaf274]|uniref:phage portal protein n=1 Tax=Pseudorhodoferax sp. Leaf274 TaxID=1736318 RepID=UPI0009E8D069|nr:phage portal protein [Pseudorhodoferax sp. Leaf274]
MLQAPARRAYAAAQVNRLTQGWSTTSASANTDIHRALDAVRARSRSLSQNDEYVRKWLALVDTNVVGPDGFRLQGRVYGADRQPDRLANDAIEAGIARWSEAGVCDVTGRHSRTDLEHIGIKQVARDGEYLFRWIRGAEAGNAFGLALQALDVDRLDTNLNRPADQGRNAIRMGVELNRYGRPVAYHLRSAHPGDLYQQAQGGQVGVVERVPAEDILHDFIADRPEQVRGMPWAHAAMPRLNNIGGYEEAAVIAARVGASKMGFFTTPEGDNAPVVTGTEVDGAGNAVPVMDADPGTFQTLPQGVEFTPFNPDYPAAMYADFVKANLRGVASGLLVAYHSLANDLEGVSFSSIRSGTLEDRDMWMLIQRWFSQSFLRRVHAEVLRVGLAFGLFVMPNGSALPLAKIDKFRPHTWQGRRWEWVDPRADIEADVAAIDAGLKSPQSVAAKLGMDYEDLLQEIKQAEDMRKAAGVVLPDRHAKAQLQQPAAPAAKPKSKSEDET